MKKDIKIITLFLKNNDYIYKDINWYLAVSLKTDSSICTPRKILRSVQRTLLKNDARVQCNQRFRASSSRERLGFPETSIAQFWGVRSNATEGSCAADE